MDVDVDMDVHVDKVDEGHGNTDEDMDKVDQWHGYKDKDVDEVAREIGIRMFTTFFIFPRTKATLLGGVQFRTSKKTPYRIEA